MNIPAICGNVFVCRCGTFSRRRPCGNSSRYSGCGNRCSRTGRLLDFQKDRSRHGLGIQHGRCERIIAQEHSETCMMQGSFSATCVLCLPLAWRNSNTAVICMLNLKQMKANQLHAYNTHFEDQICAISHKSSATWISLAFCMLQDALAICTATFFTQLSFEYQTTANQCVYVCSRESLLGTHRLGMIHVNL